MNNGAPGEMLPPNWTLATFADVFDRLQYGHTTKASSKKDGPRFLRITDLNDQGIDWSSVPGCDIKPLELEKYRLHHGDIVFARTGSIEKARRVTHPPEAVFASYLIRGRPLEPDVGPWLAYFVRSYAYVAQAVAASAGIGRPNINATSLARLQLPLAPLNEQHRIVEAIESHLTRLDAAVATLERVKANLKRYRASVLKAAVEGRLVPTEAELAQKEGRDYEPASVLLERILKERRRKWEEAELAKLKDKDQMPTDNRWKQRYQEPVSSDISMLPELPEGWCWASVDMVGEVLLGRQRAPQYLRGLHPRPYLRVANVKDDALDLSDLETMDFDEEHFAKYRLRPADILVSEGQSPELVGQSAIYHGGVEDLCFQKTLHRFRPMPPGPGSAYAQLVFRAHVRDGTFMRLASITTNIAHLTLEKFRASPFPLPPSAEQERVVSEAERLLSIADSVGRGASRQELRLARLRQAVLKWAFGGKLVDQDPADEPASVLLERIKAEREKADDDNHKTPRGGRKKAAA